MKKSEESLSYLWDTIKNTNIKIIGIPEREEGKKQAESLFKEIDFTNLGRDLNVQIYEANKTSCFITEKWTPL